jgi:hypothetical protein
VGLRNGLDEVEKRKSLTLPGLELRPLRRPARSQFLYRLRYQGMIITDEVIFALLKVHRRMNMSGGNEALSSCFLFLSYV